MTIKELKEFLEQFPEDMEILETRYSDFISMKVESWGKIKAIDVRNNRGYIMHYPSYDWRLKDPKYKAEIESVGKVKEYVHFIGN